MLRRLVFSVNNNWIPRYHVFAFGFVEHRRKHGAGKRLIPNHTALLRIIRRAKHSMTYLFTYLNNTCAGIGFVGSKLDFLGIQNT